MLESPSSWVVLWAPLPGDTEVLALECTGCRHRLEVAAGEGAANGGCGPGPRWAFGAWEHPDVLMILGAALDHTCPNPETGPDEWGQP